MNGSIFLLDGKNSSLGLAFYKSLDTVLIDEIKLFIKVTENEFDWLSPVEDIKSGFLYNLTYGGEKLGNIIESILTNMPQRTPWNTYIYGIDIKKDFTFHKNIIFFNEYSFLSIEQSDYDMINDIPNSNMSLTSGLRFKINDFSLEIFGKAYKNNLYGFENISFNQRSEHHFDQNFASIGVSLLYNF